MRKILERYRNNENGSGEVVTALFVIPMIILLLFLILDVGRYFLILGQVSDITKEATRQVEIYGGDSTRLALAKLGKPVSTELRAQLASTGANIQSVSCGGGGVKGSRVSCSVTFTYSSLMGGLVQGFAQPRQVIHYGVSEVWS